MIEKRWVDTINERCSSMFKGPTFKHKPLINTVNWQLNE